MEDKDCFLTTSDNPFDPFTQFEEWFTYDTDPSHPYCTCSLVARLTPISDALPEEMNDYFTEQTYNDLIRLFPEIPGYNGIYYKKVYKE